MADAADSSVALEDANRPSRVHGVDARDLVQVAQLPGLEEEVVLVGPGEVHLGFLFAALLMAMRLMMPTTKATATATTLLTTPKTTYTPTRAIR